MPRQFHWLLKVLDVLVVIGMSVMSIMVFLNVVLRYGFSSGISVSVEVSRMIMVWVIFLGAVAALATGTHLSVNALVARLPKGARFICFIASYAVMFWCCWLLGQGSWSLTLINWRNREALSGLPVGLTYAAGLVAAIMMGACLLVGLARALRGEIPPTWAGTQRAPSPSGINERAAGEGAQ